MGHPNLGSARCGPPALGPPFPSNVCKVFKINDLRPDFPEQACGLKVKARLLTGPAFSIYFYFNEWGITKMPHWMEIFLSCKVYSFVWLSDFGDRVWTGLGLDMGICWVFGGLVYRSCGGDRMGSTSFDRGVELIWPEGSRRVGDAEGADHVWPMWSATRTMPLRLSRFRYVF